MTAPPSPLTSRLRFQRTMDYRPIDRPPYFEEGIRDDVLEAWQAAGLPPEVDPATLFPVDRRVEIQPEVKPLPAPDRWPTSPRDLARFLSLMDGDDSARLGEDWLETVRACRGGDVVPMLRVDKGFFQALGVADWSRFAEVMRLLVKDKGLVREFMAAQGRMCARLAEIVCGQVRLEAAIFNEPLGGTTGPLISPAMYEDLILPSYVQAFKVLQAAGVKWFIFRTYANSRLMLPLVMDFGFNCLWACEVDLESMDYRDIREEHGRELRLIGGLDLDVLRLDRAAIRREIETKVPPLLADGGYVPLADGRVRADVPFENYRYYREVLTEVAGANRDQRPNRNRK